MQVGEASSITTAFMTVLTALDPRGEPHWPNQQTDNSTDPGAHEMPRVVRKHHPSEGHVGCCSDSVEGGVRGS